MCLAVDARSQDARRNIVNAFRWVYYVILKSAAAKSAKIQF
jgi:hypothetical protein